MEDNIVGWFSLKGGKRIPIKEGQSKEDAVKSALAKKDSQIKANQREAKSRNDEKNIPVTNPHKEVSSKQFNKDIAKAKDSCPPQNQWRVDVHTPEEYDEKGCKCYSTQGGSTVAVTKDGDIISVCKNANDTEIRGSDLLKHAVKMGGKKLDSFGGNHAFYTKCGFQAVSWTPFNKEYAPDGWSRSGCAEEPVIFYKYVGVGNVTTVDMGKFLTSTQPFTGDSGYDDAMAYRDKHIK